MFVEQRSNLTRDHDIALLIVTPIASSLNRLELRELLFPVTQNVRFQSA